ncbi:hypothetical protein G7046_g8259 [Stylonectria norvegica]|nr:hypothetical protein G7046_g8259 [Stylonectria norvegica]
MSSLSRAFTTRKVKMSLDMGDFHMSPHRSNSTRDQHQNSHRAPILRHKISAPIELVHTTNMLSYNAPDLPSRAARSNSSAKSDAGSDAPSAAESTPPTSPDVSPADDCPSPEPNHLSTYFLAPRDIKASTHTQPPVNAYKDKADPPAIPQRSPSHTKKNSYDAIARQRSMSRMSKEYDHSLSSMASFSFSRSSSTSTRASSTSHASVGPTQRKLTPPPVTAPSPLMPSSFQHQQRPTYKESHPFGHELAQVTELAEEFGAKSNSKLDEEDMQYLQTRGLNKFSADEYLGDIQTIFGSFFNDVATQARTAPPALAPAPLWI